MLHKRERVGDRERDWVRKTESEWGSESEGVREWGSERVREWGSERVREWESEGVREWGSEGVRELESERVREWKRVSECVCVCVCVRERERERERCQKVFQKLLLTKCQVDKLTRHQFNTLTDKLYGLIDRGRTIINEKERKNFRWNWTNAKVKRRWKMTQRYFQGKVSQQALWRDCWDCIQWPVF